jgi:hypothetical protein
MPVTGGPGRAAGTAAGALAAVLLGLLIGVVQAGLFAGFLRASRSTSSDGADRGFGGDPSLLAEAGWLIGLAVFTAIAGLIALRVLRIRWYGLVLPVLLLADFLLAGWLGTALPGHSDFRVLVLLPVLAVLLLLCRLLMPRQPHTELDQKGPYT